jgi:hypothetical protein
VLGTPIPIAASGETLETFRREDTPSLDAQFERGAAGTSLRLITATGQPLTVRVDEIPYISATGLSCRPVSVIAGREPLTTRACRFGDHWRLLRPL